MIETPVSIALAQRNRELQRTMEDMRRAHDNEVAQLRTEIREWREKAEALGHLATYAAEKANHANLRMVTRCDDGACFESDEPLGEDAHPSERLMDGRPWLPGEGVRDGS